MKSGQVDQEILALITTNVRTSREAKGDFQAQLAANNVGQNRLLEIIRKYGPEKAVFYMDRLIDYSEKRMLARIAELPRGDYSFEDFLEGDGIVDDLLAVRAKVSIQENRIVVDFTGTAPQTRGSVNCTRP